MKSPDSRWFGIGLIICLALMTGTPVSTRTPLSENTEGLIIIQGTTLKASIPPSFISLNGVLGVFYSQDEISYEQAVLLNKIIECESNWQNICNSKSCDYGQGVAQLIPSTVKYCEDKLGHKIDPFNVNDNVECAVWLLENEGYQHWGTEITEWGSFNCWKDYLTN